MRNGFAHFVRKVFARRKLLPGKFWVFVPLFRSYDQFYRAECITVSGFFIMEMVAFMQGGIGQYQLISVEICTNTQ